MTAKRLLLALNDHYPFPGFAPRAPAGTPTAICTTLPYVPRRSPGTAVSTNDPARSDGSTPGPLPGGAGSRSPPAFREEGSSGPAGAGAAFESGRKDGGPRGVRARPETLASGAAPSSLRSAARALSPGRSRPLAAGSALRAEAMGKGGGRAIMKGKMVGGRARARPPYSPGPASADSPSSWRRPGRPPCTRGAADAPSRPLPFLVVLGRREDAGRPPPRGPTDCAALPAGLEPGGRADERPLRRREAARRQLGRGVGGGRSRPGKSPPGSGGGEPPAARLSPR